ncbi:MAG: hypothetical protein D6730_09310 [Bacteroidetes bacterium]|nr:MAG: hypothetical protein D6730_09310 [Bacteroidota bacterium]
MNFNNIRVYFALFPILLCTAVSAQTVDSRFVAGLSAIFMDYQGPISGDYLQYKTFSPGISVSAHGYVNPLLNISVNSAFVPETNYPLGNGEFLSTAVTDVNLVGQFKSNNGKIFKEQAFFAPYLSTGIGLNAASNNLRWYVPAILGMRFRINQHVSFNLEGAYKFAIDGKQQHIAYSGGFVFGLPSNQPSQRPPQNRPAEPSQLISQADKQLDTDGDGIPDVDDRCPEERGLVTFFGCPAPEESNEPPQEAPKPVYAETSTEEVVIKPQPLEEPEILDNTLTKNSQPSQADIDFLAEAMDNVYFDVASNELTPDSYKVLDRVAEILKKYPDYKLKVSGYTDNQGGEKTNKILSVTRAFNVKRYLVYQKDIPLSRIISNGYSSAKPIADNSTPVGRSKNRRVEFELVR